MLNPHFHSLALDGIFNKKNNVFHAVPTLQDEDVKEIVEVTAYRVIRLLKKREIIDGTSVIVLQKNNQIDLRSKTIISQ